MVATILFKRGTATQVNEYQGLAGEIVVDTTNQTLRVLNGSLSGGSRLATFPELSGVQEQLNELEDGFAPALNEKADKIIALIAGEGLTGGGDLSENVTFNLGTPGTINDESINSTSVGGHTHAIDITPAKIGLENVDNTSDLNKPISTATQNALNLKIDLSEKGQPLGVPTLDVGGKIPLSQLSDSIVGQVEYQGTWNPETNEPTLPNSPTQKGQYYIATTDGTFAGIEFFTGDWIISEGNDPYHWSKVSNTDAVVSVNGYIGAVNLTAADVGLGNVDNTSDANKPISTATQTALNDKVDVEAGKGLSANDFTDTLLSKLNGIESGAEVNTVVSVAGKTGAVTLIKDDVGLNQVQNFDVATTAEAEVGTATNKYMTPANVISCIEAGNWIIDCGTF